MTNTELKWIKEIRDNTKQLERIAKRLDVISRQLDRLDRKTEPQYSEDDMYWLSLAEDVANGKMSDAGANQAWFEYINRKDENSSEKPNNLSEKPTSSTISKMEQVDEPKTQTETQNSNLTFKKADERCEVCGHYKLTCDLFSEICRYKPKDEPQTDCTTCRHASDPWYSEACDGCCENNDHYEPQTEREETK